LEVEGPGLIVWTATRSLIPKKGEYIVGRSTIVMTVPSVSPNMITTDIETQNTSVSSGITPNTVVPAATIVKVKSEQARIFLDRHLPRFL